ncbi:vitamin B12 ABC transporter substrate-binding protein BtuF, partial [Salmonella enterica subsp. enterica serovar Infantis]
AKQMFRALVALLLTLPVRLYAAPRVITHSPANTELAFAAGITPGGVSSYSDYPPDAHTLEPVSPWPGRNLDRRVAL